MIRDLTILALAAIVIALVVRDRRREVAARNAERAHRHPSRRDLPATPVIATGDAAYLALPADPTPMFDGVIDEHPWVAEQLLAHELNDDEAVSRWLA